jgi:hypothetical protein
VEAQLGLNPCRGLGLDGVDRERSSIIAPTELGELFAACRVRFSLCRRHAFRLEFCMQSVNLGERRCAFGLDFVEDIERRKSSASAGGDDAFAKRAAASASAPIDATPAIPTVRTVRRFMVVVVLA